MMSVRAFVSLVALFLLPQAVSPQSTPGSTWATGVQLLLGPGPPEGYVLPDCREGLTAGVGISVMRSLNRYAEVVGELAYLADLSSTTCDIFFAPPQGPYNHLSIEGTQFPKLTPSVKLSVGPDRTDRTVNLRVAAGGGYAFGTGRAFFSTGVVIVLGNQARRHFSIGYDSWFLSAPVRFAYQQLEGEMVVAEDLRISDKDGRLDMISLAVVLPIR